MAVALLVGSGLVYPSSSASAASASWVIPAAAGEATSAVTPTANGDILHCFGSTNAAGDSVTTIIGRHADGSVVFTHSSVNNTASSLDLECLTNAGSNQPTVRPALTGDAYYLSGRDQTGNDYVMAFSAGRELWRTPIQSIYPLAAVTPMVLDIKAGTDGAVYALEWIENGFAGDEYYLESLNPVTGTRQWRSAFPRGVAFFGVTSGGVVATTRDGDVRWFDTSGHITAETSIPTVQSAPATRRVVFNVSPDGTVDYAVSGDGDFNSGPATCTDTGGSVGQVKPGSPNGIPTWALAFSPTACHIFNSVDPLPNGDVVLTNAVAYGGNVLGDVLVVGGAGGGAVQWELPDLTLSPGETGLAVDTSGGILLTASTQVDCADPNNPGEVCNAAQPEILSGGTGAIIAAQVFSRTGTGAVSFLGTSSAADRGLAYVGGYGKQIPSDNYAYFLASVPMPGFGAPWPRSVLAAGSTVPPTQLSARLSDPSPADKLLRRGLTIEVASSPGAAATSRFEYGWSPANSPSKSPQVGRQRCTVLTGLCTVSFAATSPDQSWHLWVRAIDVTGAATPWVLARTSGGSDTVQTPPAPIFVALGDSVTSGHHFGYGDVVTACFDAAYGYPVYASAAFESALPVQWRRRDAYSNYARSGYSVAPHAGQRTGSVQTGGVDACGFDWSSVPLETASAILRANAGSWNKVVITAGINDTDWGDRVKSVIKNSWANSFYDKSSCAKDLSSWDGYTARGQSITAGVRTVVESLVRSDPAVRLTWLSYYNIAGTGTSISVVTPAFPAVCKGPVDRALGHMTDLIRAGLNGHSYTWVNSDSAMRMNDSRIQPFFQTVLLEGLLFGSAFQIGWPHPNTAGAKAIGALITP